MLDACVVGTERVYRPHATRTISHTFVLDNALLVQSARGWRNARQTGGFSYAEPSGR